MATNYTGTIDTSFSIRGFRGINEAGGQKNINPEYAEEAENCNTRGNILAPARLPLRVLSELPSAIGTLAWFHRRWTSDEQQDVLVAAAGGKLYARRWHDNGWRMIGNGYQSDDWDFITYETNPEGSEAPIDVLLMSNALDGMICVYGNDWSVEPVPTPKKFGVICRHAERIWGASIEGDPDMLVYSAPYDPFDWTQNDEFPEDGAGDILQPTWDGDSFIDLVNWGDYLLAFKRNSVWRIMGTDPGQYAMVQQYGQDGAVSENSISIDQDTVFMYSGTGVSYYSGNGVAPLQRDALLSVFSRVNRHAIGGITGICWEHKYILALPLDNSTVNNAIVEFDTVDNSWMLRTGIQVASFALFNDKLLMTTPTHPGLIYAYDSGLPQSARWVIHWQDQSAKNTVKSMFLVYMSLDSDEDTELSVSVQTEKKVKTKVLRAGPSYKKRIKPIRITNQGREWRLIVEGKAGPAWRIASGIQIDMETDAD